MISRMFSFMHVIFGVLQIAIKEKFIKIYKYY